MQPKIVLIVDDSQDYLDMVRHKIKNAFPNCSIQTATSCQGAMDACATHAVEMVITDFLIGNERGSTIVDFCRSYGAPVMVLTGCPVEEVQEQLPPRTSVLNKFVAINGESMIQEIKGIDFHEKAI